MKTTIILFIASIYCSMSFAQDDITISDTIFLKPQHVEGRWIEHVENSTNKNIYIFRADNSFHKASDSGDIIIFNVGGKYFLNDDTIKVICQDFSRPNVAANVKTIYLQVIALSDTELNIYKTENKRTEFIRLTKQSVK